MLGKWLEEYGKLGSYELCWKSSVNPNGFSSGCGGKKDTITIVRGSKTDQYYGWKTVNILYGGFTDIPWQSRFF